MRRGAECTGAMRCAHGGQHRDVKCLERTGTVTVGARLGWPVVCASIGALTAYVLGTDRDCGAGVRVAVQSSITPS